MIRSALLICLLFSTQLMASMDIKTYVAETIEKELNKNNPSGSPTRFEVSWDKCDFIIDTVMHGDLYEKCSFNPNSSVNVGRGVLHQRFPITNYLSISGGTCKDRRIERNKETRFLILDPENKKYLQTLAELIQLGQKSC